jgi:hypothetical protein
VTLWAFLAQVLSEDGTCREAVSRVRAYFAQRRKKTPSAKTGAYCKARQRLSEGLLRRLLTQSATELENQAGPQQLWHGKRVRIVDGTGISMPDTPENQSAYPQPSSQAPGCGFPVLRLVVLFSLVTGAWVSYALGALSSSEMVLFRQVLEELRCGDLLMGDRYYGNFWVVASLQEAGVDVLLRLSASRNIDFRRGQRLGKDDHLVVWNKPATRPHYLPPAEYEALPQEIALREIRGTVAWNGWRPRPVVVVTTLLDPKRYPRQALLELYARRYQCELRLRDIKIALHMDVLRTQSPEMVRKELLAKLLAYNLIRRPLWDAGVCAGVPPLRLSFKGAVQHVRIFAPLLAALTPGARKELNALLLQTLAAELVPERPGRIEPRLKKRRPKSFGWLQKPRTLCRRLLSQGRKLK